ncbi:glycosyltransferase, partial [Fulvivirga lutimaris]|uniref:glycosyltransferase n=1 Tax=Fulvivirga lutimaris TaxID=1819566 RepID=UPI0012BB9FC7
GKAEDVRAFINNADCVVLPSYREGTPKSLLEAASSGKPIVTTDVPGCRDVVDDRVNGLLCRMKDPEDLANKLETMASLNNDELKNLGVNGRKKVENQFDEQIVIKKYLNTIQELLS